MMTSKRSRRQLSPTDLGKDESCLGDDESESLVEGLVEAVERDPGAFPNEGALAAGARVSLGKLHELCRLYYHSTPSLLLNHARVAAAQRALLADGRSIADIARDVGYENLSGFNLTFHEWTAMSPPEFRQLGQRSRFDLSLPPNFPLQRMLRYLGRDPNSLTDRVDSQTYVAAFRLGRNHSSEEAVLVRVEFLPPVARCEIVSRSTLGPKALIHLHTGLLATLGLTGNPAEFETRVAAAPELAPLIDGQRGLRVPLIADPFDALVWAIVGQQITLSFAFTLRRRLIELVGTMVGEGLFIPPTPEVVAALDPGDLTKLAFSRAKAAYLIDAARLVVEGRLPLAGLKGKSATRIERTLLAVRGIGPWSAHYLLMRSYGFLDCVPVGDAVLAAGLQRFFALVDRPNKDETLTLMNRFSPYRSLATFHLWQRHGTVA